MYLPTAIATRASAGMAGQGKPVRSTRSSIRVRSSPLMDRTALPGSSLGTISWKVITPSISTVAEPAMVTTRITRVGGSKYPVGSRSVSSGDPLLTANDKSKPLLPVALTCTLAETSDSITSRGTGLGWTAPISRLRVISLATRHPRGQRDDDGRPGLLGQVARPVDQVGVGQQPGQLGVTEFGRRDLVGTLTRPYQVRALRRQLPGLGQEAAQQVRHRGPVGRGPGGGADGGIAAGRAHLRVLPVSVMAGAPVPAAGRRCRPPGRRGFPRCGGSRGRASTPGG